MLQGRPVTPEALEEISDRLYESFLQEAAINFVSFSLLGHRILNDRALDSRTKSELNQI